MKLVKGMCLVVLPLKKDCPLSKSIIYLEKDKVVESIKYLLENKEVEVQEADEIEKEFCHHMYKKLEFQKISFPYESLKLYKDLKNN